MTILIDRRAASRLAKALRVHASLPTHSAAMTATARALGMRDDNAMAAALRNDGVVTLRVPVRPDGVTSAFLKTCRPSLASAAEHLRRMFAATGILPKTVSKDDEDDKFGAAMVGCLLGAAHAWEGCRIVMAGHTPIAMNLLGDGVQARCEAAASHCVPLDLKAMAARAGVTPRSLGEALAEELAYEMELGEVDMDEVAGTSDDPGAAHLVALRVAQDHEGDEPGGWDVAVAQMLRWTIGMTLVNEHPMFGNQFPMLADVDGEEVTLILYAVRGGLGEPFRFHAVREGEAVPRMNDGEANFSSPFTFIEVDVGPDGSFEVQPPSR